MCVGCAGECPGSEAVRGIVIEINKLSLGHESESDISRGGSLSEYLISGESR